MASALILPTHASAQSLRCNASTPSLSVKTSTTTTRYIRTKSAADLTHLHGGGGSHVGGLGGGEIGFKTANKFEISSLAGRACVKLKNVDLTFYAKPEIHIASNFHRNSCEYNAVLNHEQGHIRILRKFVREFSPKIKTELARIVRQVDADIGPIPESQVKSAQSKIQSEVLKRLERYNATILPILEKRQKAHDTPQEYARVAAKCSKWNERLSRTR